MSMVDILLPDVNHAKLFKAHVQGAIVRSVASLVMWLFALFAFWADEIKGFHFIGITCSVLLLVLINPPTLFILRRTAPNNVYASISLGINIIEILGYTAVIYFLGGIEATYLTPIYAANIAYIGAMSPQKRLFIVTSFCAFAFGLMVALDGLGILPSQKVDPHFNPSISTQFFKAFAVIALLFIVAYISSFTAGQLTKARYGLRQKNKDLEKALNEIKTLRGILPICSFCKKVRDDRGYWEKVDVYIQKHSQADISHGICPDCVKRYYPDIYKELNPDCKGRTGF